jgi:hypothetical protein
MAIHRIVVNGRQKDWSETKIGFDQVVVIALGEKKPQTAYTITYTKGPKENPQGSLTSGQTVDVKNEMVFNVTATDKS